MRNTFDIVFGYQLSPVTSMLPAVKFSKHNELPLFIYCLDVWPESVESIFHKGSLFYKSIEYLSKYIYKSADKIDVSTPCFTDYIESLIGIKEEILWLPQHAEDIKLFRTEQGIKQSINGEMHFYFIGNVGSSQNVEGIIQALSIAIHKNKIILHIVGSGSSLEVVKAECIKHSLNDHVVFHGRQPKNKLNEYYNLADVCIVSLRREGLIGKTIPGKLQEYMSAGKSILAFIDGDTAKIIKDANCGLSVPAEDIKRLGEAMDYIVENREMLNIWGQNARLFYETHFTLDKYVQTLENELSSLCKRS